MTTCSKLPRIGADGGRLGGGHRDQLDIFADQPRKHLLHVHDQRIQLHHARR
jgi:hypothetical protein